MFSKLYARFRAQFDLTLNNIDRKSLRGLFYPIDLGCADVVSVEAGVEAVDQNASVPIHSKVHSWWVGGAIIHAEAQLRG